jgi:hypothetical protein
VDPYRNPAAYIRILSEIYHAERVALEWFSKLDDPLFIEQTQAYGGARKMLVRDEAAHMKDLEELVRSLGGDGIAPPDPSTRRFWEQVKVGSASDWGDVFPLRSTAVAIFCLVSESFGYSFLYWLAHTTIDGAIRDKLMDNVRDEERHVRVSMALLRRSFEQDPRFWWDMSIYLPAYLFTARKAGRAQSRMLGELGLDYYEVTSSCFRFLRELLLLVLEGAPLLHPSLRPWLDRCADLMYSPLGMRGLHTAMYLPDLPGMWTGVRLWSRLSRGLRERARTS